jgi:3-mercaptopyruvate sulfurtransferase SseA
MRSKSIYSMIILAVALVLAACNAADDSVSTSTKKKVVLEPETVHADGARRITTAELADLIEADEAVVVDVRNQDSFDQGHIPGSRLIPASEILNHVNDLPRDKMIVTYCS